MWGHGPLTAKPLSSTLLLPLPLLPKSSATAATNFRNVPDPARPPGGPLSASTDFCCRRRRGLLLVGLRGVKIVTTSNLAKVQKSENLWRVAVATKGGPSLSNFVVFTDFNLQFVHFRHLSFAPKRAAYHRASAPSPANQKQRAAEVHARFYLYARCLCARSLRHILSTPGIGECVQHRFSCFRVSTWCLFIILLQRWCHPCFLRFHVSCPELRPP